MEYINITGISATAKAGSCLRDAIIEGVKLSMEERQTVVVKHNDRHYRIDPTEVLQSIYDNNSKKI